MAPFQTPDLLHAVLGALALASAAAAAGLYGARRGLERRARELESDLAKIRSEPMRLEYRIERFDALWFAAVAASPASKEVLSVNAGAPHCRSCASPLAALGTGGWSCRGCGTQVSADLADVFVLDTVAKLALQYFRERHPDYRVPYKQL